MAKTLDDIAKETLGAQQLELMKAEMIISQLQDRVAELEAQLKNGDGNDRVAGQKNSQSG